jgi:hypothetical protein
LGPIPAVETAGYCRLSRWDLGCGGPCGFAAFVPSVALKKQDLQIIDIKQTVQFLFFP